MRRGLDIGASPCFRPRGIEPLGRPRMTGFTKPGSDKAKATYFHAIAHWRDRWQDESCPTR